MAVGGVFDTSQFSTLILHTPVNADRLLLHYYCCRKFVTLSLRPIIPPAQVKAARLPLSIIAPATLVKPKNDTSANLCTAARNLDTRGAN